MRRMIPSLGPGAAATEQGQQFHGGKHHLARDNLLAAADSGDAGQDPEPARIGPTGDVGDVAAPAGSDFMKGKEYAWRQAHDQMHPHLTEDGLHSNRLQPAPGRRGVSDRRQRRTGRQSAVTLQ